MRVLSICCVTCPPLTTLCQQEPDHVVTSCSHDTSRIAWAKLLARVGEEFPLACPNCGGDIRLISFITQPEMIRKILTYLGEPLVPPPVSPARGPPVDWDDLVQAEDDHILHQTSPEDVPMIDIHRRGRKVRLLYETRSRSRTEGDSQAVCAAGEILPVCRLPSFAFLVS